MPARYLQIPNGFASTFFVRNGKACANFTRGRVLFDAQPPAVADKVTIEVLVPDALLRPTIKHDLRFFDPEDNPSEPKVDDASPVAGCHTLAIEGDSGVILASEVCLPARPL